MANYFMDSSALVKRYVSESGTTWIRSLTDAASLNVIYVARIAGAETVQVQAGCVALGVPGITFLSADQALNAAAVAEGLTVDDPNLQP